MKSFNHQTKILAGSMILIVALITGYWVKSKNSSTNVSESQNQRSEQLPSAAPETASAPSGSNPEPLAESGTQAESATNPAENTQNDTLATGSTPEQKTSPKTEVNGCFTSKVALKSGSAQSLSNSIFIAGKKLNSNSVCVRANGVPQKNQVESTPDGLKVNLGAIPGIGTQAVELTVSYCNQKQNCLETCKIPKDEFMAALGSDDSEDDTSADAGWAGGSDSHQQVKQEMKHFSGSITGEKDNSSRALYQALEPVTTCQKSTEVAHR